MEAPGGAGAVAEAVGPAAIDSNDSSTPNDGAPETPAAGSDPGQGPSFGRELGEFEIEDERHGVISVTPHVRYLYERDRRSYVPQRTEAWYARRREHLTASQIASACGENPYESPIMALRRKVGTVPSFTGSAATEHGNKYEDVAIEKYERQTGRKVISFGLMDSLNENEDWLAGSPDGITSCGRLIEVKCPYRRKPNGTVPSHYVHQIQTLMHILKLEVCDFIEYVPAGVWQEEIFTVVEVRRDHFFWWRIFPKLVRFWDQVKTKRAEGAEKLQEELLEEERKAQERKEKRENKRVIDLTPCLIDLGPMT